MSIFHYIENKILVFLLERLKIANMNAKVFEALVEKIMVTGVEAVILREKNDVLEILLTKRPDDDINWTGAIHVPGSIARKTDNFFEDSLKRVAQKELGISEFESIIFAGSAVYVEKGRRGNTIGIVYLCTIRDGEVPAEVGKFYPVDELNKVYMENSPVADRKYIIPIGLKKFKELRKV